MLRCVSAFGSGRGFSYTSDVGSNMAAMEMFGDLVVFSMPGDIVLFIPSRYEGANGRVG